MSRKDDERPLDPGKPPRNVVTCSVSAKARPGGHDTATRTEIARRVARLAGFAYAGDYDPSFRYHEPPYFVPSHTLTAADAAKLRIRTPDDLFGGVVPVALAATKTITHPLVADDAHAPEGWSFAFPRYVADAVLAGYSAFTRDDLLRAGRTLLYGGPVRVKLASGIAGLGQWEVRDNVELNAIVAEIDDDEIAVNGVVVEENLAAVATQSVGQITVAGFEASYCGTQRLTRNNAGIEVYGGSALRVVRGGFDALLDQDLGPAMRMAIQQARMYDDAATACFHGFFASRRNYDVAQGTDNEGRPRSGVLEQSWRIGGASGAEVAALEAFRVDPSLRAIGASSYEIYGESPDVPDDATIYFRGVDPHVGPLTKYTLIDRHADP